LPAARLGRCCGGKRQWLAVRSISKRSIKETHMLPIASVSSAPPALTSVNTQHHRKGSRVQSAGSDSGTAQSAKVPGGTAQSLFSSLLSSLEQVIGVKLSAATPKTAPAAATGQTATAAQTGRTLVANPAASRVNVKA
jgi:hypothetical protein